MNDRSIIIENEQNQRSRALSLLHHYSQSLGMLKPNITEPWGGSSEWDPVEWGTMQSNSLYCRTKEGNVKKLRKEQTSSKFHVRYSFVQYFNN